MASVTSEIVWLIVLLSTFGHIHKQPTSFYCDSKAALYIATNPIFHEKTKHIEIDCHFIRRKSKMELSKLSICLQDIS